MGRGVSGRRKRWSARRALVLGSCLLPSFVTAVAVTEHASARAGVSQYIGESYAMDLLYNPASQMCVGQQSQLSVQVTQFGEYIDPDGNPYQAQRANRNLAFVLSRSSNPGVVELKVLSSQLSGTQVVTYQVTALKVGTSQLSFRLDPGRVNGPQVSKTVDSRVVECDYKVDTSSMWHMVDSRQNIVALTVVHTTLRKTAESPSGVFRLETPGTGFSDAENVASNFKPPCTGTYNLPNSNVLVEGALDTNSHTVTIGLTYFPVPVLTAVTCIRPHGSSSDDSQIDQVQFKVRASGGGGQKRHGVSNGLGTFRGWIFYTVTPIPR